MRSSDFPATVSPRLTRADGGEAHHPARRSGMGGLEQIILQDIIRRVVEDPKSAPAIQARIAQMQRGAMNHRD